MRINSRSEEIAASSQLPESKRVSRDSQAAPAPAPGTGGQDRVELSDLFSRLARAIQKGAASHAQRIEQLAQALERGTYAVDEMAVSRAILESALRTT